MISPANAELLGKQLVDLYSDAEQTMLRRIAKRLAEGDTEAPDWEDRKLAQLQRLRTDAQRMVDDLDEALPDEAMEAVRTAYNRGAASAGGDLKKIGTSDAIAFGQVNLERVEAIARDLSGSLSQTHRRLLRWQDDAYRHVVGSAVSQAATGTITRREAAARALDDLARRSVPGFVDSAGKSWDLASYTEMATRTGLGRATVDGHTDRLLQAGHDLVIVSEHEESCPTCDEWEGQVLSLSGDGEHPTRADAEAGGLFHANCRHNIGLFDDRIMEPGRREREDPEAYEERQQQRHLERKIREWKRREAAAMTDEQQGRAKAKVREWQARQRQFVDEHGRRRNYAREQLGAR